MSVRACGRVVAAILVLPGLFLAEATAGPWRQIAGQRLTINTVEAFQAESDDRQFSELISRSYSEYGLPNRLTVGAKLATAQHQTLAEDYTVSATGITEADVFLRYQLPGDGHVVSGVKLTGGFGTSKFAGSQRVMGQDAALAGSWLVGVGSDWAFAEAESGLRMSLGDDAHQMRVTATAGIKRGRAMLLARTFHALAITDPQPTGNDYDRSSVSLSAVLPLRKRVLFEFGGKTDLYSRNLDRGAAVFFSLWWTP